MARDDVPADGSAPRSPSGGAPRASGPGDHGTTPGAQDPASQWTPDELEAVRRQLTEEVEHLRTEVVTIDDRVAGLIHDSGDGAGDDQAESGSKAFEREHEQTLANIAREAIEQSRRALGRLDDDSYGTCESCGRAIAKPRLQAFPRATLCVQCKQREEQH